LKSIEPGIKEMEKVGSLQKDIRDFHDEAVKPETQKK